MNVVGAEGARLTRLLPAVRMTVPPGPSGPAVPLAMVPEKPMTPPLMVVLPV